MRYITAEFMANYDDIDQRIHGSGPLEVRLEDGHVFLTFEFRGRDEDYITIAVQARDLLDVIVDELCKPSDED